ncbi:type II toxin-antitoxin system HipA family toxin [Fibrobacter sp.]|uniref:type II toxin-antitoxin system HipA family toxin n=1 Tax=Fibrobacter sp. TaxID=35828 RepID=UPI0025BD654F|nr:type II toxin-antitoxin system HipA family toxin [Fibrobacter sp.]MBR3071816.1 type II toxin-antitoxin system HipA family toxin [Fibrobacter sp.]
MKLSVYLGENLAGHLTSTAQNGVVFSYDPAYIEAGLPPLSLSLPLSTNEYPQKKCLPFFEGLLPEGDVKKRISDYLHVSETSTLKLLKELGGECAGMVSILPEGEQNKIQSTYTFSPENYETLSQKNLVEYIRNIDARPLLKAKEKLRLSLAGAQEKLPLAYKNGKFYMPKNGAPSTHIVKPTGQGTLSTLSANEYICMKLAEQSGLQVPNTKLIQIEDVEFLLIERYDRLCKGNEISRLHQEDACQALGILSNNKYQNDGGPSIADIYTLIKTQTTIPLLETRAFLQYLLFNFIIGNCDAHGKNYSLIFQDNSVKLTPMYDTVCTLAYPNLTQKLSMKIGKHYEIQKVNQADFEMLGNQIGLKPKTILDTFNGLVEKIDNAFEIIKNDPILKKHSDILETIQHKLIRTI